MPVIDRNVSAIKRLFAREFWWIVYTISRLIAGSGSEADAIVISGSSRSGTTWLMEILETLRGYRSIFEPLNREWYKEVRNIHLEGYPRPYIPPDVENPDLENYLGRVFQGKVSGHVELRPRLKTIFKFLTSPKVVVKFIRANRLLPWIYNRFRVRAIYLMIRHPCATIASQLNIGWRIDPRVWTPVVKELFNHDPDVRDELLRIIKRPEDPVEPWALMWALDYYIPLSMPRPHPWYTVVYEKLLLDGESELGNIFRWIGETPSDAAYARLARPSSAANKSVRKVGEINPSDQLIKWKRSLSLDQIKRILRITELVGLTFYTESEEPDYVELAKWSRVG